MCQSFYSLPPVPARTADLKNILTMTQLNDFYQLGLGYERLLGVLGMQRH